MCSESMHSIQAYVNRPNTIKTLLPVISKLHYKPYYRSNAYYFMLCNKNVDFTLNMIGSRDDSAVRTLHLFKLTVS